MFRAGARRAESQFTHHSTAIHQYLRSLSESLPPFYLIDRHSGVWREIYFYPDYHSHCDRECWNSITTRSEQLRKVFASNENVNRTAEQLSRPKKRFVLCEVEVSAMPWGRDEKSIWSDEVDAGVSQMQAWEGFRLKRNSKSGGKSFSSSFSVEWQDSYWKNLVPRCWVM